MKKLLVALVLAPICGAFLLGPALAQKTKSQLLTEVGTTFPDNTTGSITPLGVRTFQNDVINSIMPAAPVVSGNLACFDGTTGLLKDCGSAPGGVSSFMGAMGVITSSPTDGLNLSSQNVSTVFQDSGTGSQSATIRAKLLGEAINVVTGFGVDNTGTTNTAAAFQNALNAAKSSGRCLYVPPGTYRIDTALTYLSSTANVPGLCMIGSGMKSTIFQTHVGSGWFLTIDGYNGGAGFTFQYGMHLEGFSLRNDAGTAVTGGIRITANWHGLVDSIHIDGINNFAALQVYSVLGTDSDLPNFIQIARTEISNSDVAFRCFAPSAGPCVGTLEIGPHNWISGNNNCAMLYAPLIVSIHDNTLAACATSALSFPYNNLNVQVADVVRNHFDGFGTSAYAISMPAVIGGHISYNQFRLNSGTGSGIVDLGGATTITNAMRIENNIINIGPSITPFKAFNIQGLAANITIDNTYWDVFDAAGQTRFSIDPSARGINIIDDGFERGRNYSETVSSFTPDLRKGLAQRVINTGAITVNAPTLTHLLGGERFNLCVVNNSGGSLTPTFNAIYLTVAPSIASSKRACVDFVYDINSTLWVQAGAWSPSL